MKLTECTPSIGAEISDVDLSNLSSKLLQDSIRAALHKHQVIFFRDQHLTPDQLLVLARIFGKPTANPHPKFGCVDGRQEVSLVINDEHNPPDINVWHSDLTYYEKPATTCVLQCIECPDSGGDTLWASMSSAYNALSDSMKSMIENLSVYHQLPLDGFPQDLVKTALDNPVSAVHPMIRIIPETKQKSLFLNRVYSHHITDMNRAESSGLLSALFSHAESPDFQIRFKWTKGAIAIWDNRSTQHFAVADYYPQRRVMHRVALAGERVIGLSG